MIPQPPKFLSVEAKRIWRQTCLDYHVDDDIGLVLLRTALEAYDQLTKVRAVLTAQGLTVEDRFGQIRPHPLLTAQHNLRTQLVSAVRALRLDVVPFVGDRDE